MLKSGIRITVAEESQNEYHKGWDKNEDTNSEKTKRELRKERFALWASSG